MKEVNEFFYSPIINHYISSYMTGRCTIVILNYAVFLNIRSPMIELDTDVKEIDAF